MRADATNAKWRTSGPASSRTIRLMSRACSRQVDLRPGNGAGLRRYPVVPSHHPASTRSTALPTLSGPVLGDAQIPAAAGFGLAGRACLCPASFTSDSTPQRWSSIGVQRPSGAGSAPTLQLQLAQYPVLDPVLVPPLAGI